MRHHHQLLLQAVCFPANTGISSFATGRSRAAIAGFPAYARTFYFRLTPSDVVQSALSCPRPSVSRDDKVISVPSSARLKFLRQSRPDHCSCARHDTASANINRIDFPFVALHFDPVCGASNCSRGFFASENKLALPFNRVQNAAHSTLPRGQACANAFAHDGFKTTELFRQTKVSFQITLVYRAHFPVALPHSPLDFTPGVSGHTADIDVPVFKGDEGIIAIETRGMKTNHRKSKHNAQPHSFFKPGSQYASSRP